MFEDLVSNLLSTYLGDYLEGLSKKDLKISLWNGDVELKNIRVKTEALDFLNLPIQVKEGFVGTLTLKIPWKHLGSKATKIYIDDVFVIACPKSELVFDEEAEKEKEKEKKREQLSAIDENELRMEKERSAKEDTSAMAKLVAKIIDNFQLRISNVHIRFEDHSSCPGHSFAAGVILEKLRLYSPSEDNDNDGGVLIPGIIKKKVKLSRFGIYWDFDNDVCINTKTVEKMKAGMLTPFHTDGKHPVDASLMPQHYILSPISLQLHAVLDTRSVELRKRPATEVVDEVVAELGWSEKIDQFKRIIKGYRHIRKDGVRGRSADDEWSLLESYLLEKYGDQCTSFNMAQAKEFCFMCWDRSNRASPMVMIDGDLDQFVLQLEQKQYRDMLQFVSGLSMQTLRAKYKRFKPDCLPEQKSVMHDNKQRRHNTGWKEYMHFKRQRAEYIDLYKRKLGAPPPLKKDPEGLARLQKLEDKLSIENVLLFRKVASYELEQEEKLQNELRAKEKKKKEEKSLFNRLRNSLKKDKKKKHSEEEEEEEEKEINLEDLEWSDDKRNALFAEFDIKPGEAAPWEGGRPTDVQVTVNFHIQQVGVVLTRENVNILTMVATEMAARVWLRKAYVQVWAAMGDLYLEDGSARCAKWPRIIYTEKNALANPEKAKIFLPDGLVKSKQVPFLQAAIELPALERDVDVDVKLVTLPLCVVGNIASLMDLAAFFVPDLAKVNMHSISATVSSAYNNYSTTKKMKLKVVKEVSAHKLLALDVYLGAVHVLLPEDIQKTVEETEMVVCRLGDISVVSNPVRVGVEETLTEKNIYNDMKINVSQINVLMTNKQADWAKPDVQKAKNLYLVNDFNFNANIGLSIAPSEPEFASTKVGAELDMVQIYLTRPKYLNLLGFADRFVKNTTAIISNSDVDFSSLTEQAKEAASNAMAVRKEEKKEEKEGGKEEEGKKEEEREEREEENREVLQEEQDEDEIHLLQRNRTLEVHAMLGGISVLIEDTPANNEPMAIIEATVRGLQIDVQQRTFDMNVEVALEAIEVKDCLQTAVKEEDTFLVVSHAITKEGKCTKDEKQSLFRVSVAIVQAASPDYLKAESDVAVKIAFGALSILAFRPTVYHLLRFIAPVREGETQPNPAQQGLNTSVEEDIAIEEVAAEEDIAIEEDRYAMRERRDSFASVSSILSQALDDRAITLKERAADLLQNKASKMAETARPLPTNWLRKQVTLSLSLQSLSVLVNADTGRGIVFANISGIHVGVAICPASITVEGSLADIGVEDVSRGCGLYPSVLRICDRQQEDERFVDFSIALYSDTRFPRYPGYPLAAKAVVCAPEVTLRMRVIDELLRYTQAGPIADGLALLQASKEVEAEMDPIKLDNIPMVSGDVDALSVASSISTSSVSSVSSKASRRASRHVSKSLKNTAMMVGKSYLHLNRTQPTDATTLEDEGEKLPMELPLIDIVIKSFRVRAPAGSDTAEIATFAFGELTVKNEPPLCEDCDDRLIVKEASKKNTLNTLRVSLTNMRAVTAIADSHGVVSDRALLGGIDVSVTVVLATIMEVNARVTKVALAVNEQQLAFVLKCVKGNFAEKAIECTDEIVPKTKEEKKEGEKEVTLKTASGNAPEGNTLSSTLLGELDTIEEEEEEEEEEDGELSLARAQEEVKKTAAEMTFRGEFVFDGVSLELLSGGGGYPADSGRVIYEQVGTLRESISSVDLGVLQAFVNLHGSDITAGVSLSHITVVDTRKDTPIHADYRTPLQFGALAKPAFSALVEMHDRDIRTFSELKAYYDGEKKTVPEIQASISVGTLRVVPTPWLFDILQIVQGIGERVMGDDLESAKKELETRLKEREEAKEKALLEEHEQKKNANRQGRVAKQENAENAENGENSENGTDRKALIPHITAEVKMDNPYIFLVEDTTDPHSSSLLLSFSFSASATVSPLMDIDASLSLRNVRSCRSHPCDGLIPVPGMTDALIPFDLNVNVHLEDNMQNVRGTVMTNRDLELRIGILDVKLIMNALENLLPQKNEEEEEMNNARTKEEEEKKEEETEEEKQRAALLKEIQEMKKKEAMETSALNSMTITFTVFLNKLAITVVNDTKEFDLPVLQMEVSDVSLTFNKKPDITTIDAMLTVSADFYNAGLTVWEPVLETWAIQARVEQEPRDRVVQKLTATQDSKLATSLALTRVKIDAPNMLNLNISSAFIHVALQSVSAFLDCRETTQKLGNGYYIGVRNGTGLDVTYSVKSDDGINALLASQTKQEVEDHRDDAVWAGLADVSLRAGRRTSWVSIHRQSPRLRVFDMVPVLSQATKLALADVCEMRSVPGVFCEVCQFRNEQQEKEKGGAEEEEIVQLFMENEDEVAKWRAAWESACQPVEEVPEEDVEPERLVSRATMSSVMLTTLPAHPSLALKFLKQPYKKLQPRVLRVEVEDYPAFEFQVDRVTSAFVPLRKEGAPDRNVVVEAAVERGRKILSVASTVCVRNDCHTDLWCGFGPAVKETEIAYAEVACEEMKRGQKRWADVTTATTSALYVSDSEELVRCLPLEQLCVNGFHRTINIGAAGKPHYVNLTVEEKAVPSVFDAKDVLRTYTIILTHTVELENLLPVPIEFRVLSKHDTVVEEGEVNEGGQMALHLCQFTKEEPHRISVRVKGAKYPFPAYADSMDIIHKEAGILYLSSKFEELHLNLEYLVSKSPQHLLTVQLFCDYWVMNKTGDELIIQDSKAKEFSYTIPAHPLTLKNLSETVCNKETLLMPTLFSVRKKEKNETARLTINGYNLSEAFSVNTLGMSGTITIASRDGQAPERCYSISISRAPGLFARSLVLTITPTYLIVNRTGTTVSLRQLEAEDRMTLAADGYQAFHWSSRSGRHSVQFHLDGQRYDWSEPVELVPGHHSLLLPKQPASNKHTPELHLNLEDPVHAPWSILQLDIACVNSQCFVFLRKLDPAYLPFCITNNTTLDTFTVVQEGAPFNTALTLAPLMSRVYTLPKINAASTLHVYTNAVDAPANKNAYSVQLSLDVSKPGQLGIIKLKNPNRAVNVSITIQNSMKVILFDEIPAKSLFTLLKRPEGDRTHLQYLARRRKDLQQRALDLANAVDAKSAFISDYIAEQERSGSGIPPSARATYLQLLCGTDTSVTGGLLSTGKLSLVSHVARAKVQFRVGNEWLETPLTRGRLNYWCTSKVLNEVDEVEMKMEVRADLQLPVVGTARLRLGDYVEKECLYDLLVPFYSDNGNLVGHAEVRFVNVCIPEVAEAGFEKQELSERLLEVKQTLQRLQNEIHIERTLGRSHGEDRSLSRALHTGVYHNRTSMLASTSIINSLRMSSVHTPSEPSGLNGLNGLTSSYSMESSLTTLGSSMTLLNNEENTDEMEQNLSFCVHLHQLEKIPLSEAELQQIYVTASIGSSTLRLPASTNIQPDEDNYPSEEITVTVTEADIDFQLLQEGKTILVSQITSDSTSARAGVKVGHVLCDVDGEGVPSSLAQLQAELATGEEISLTFVAPPSLTYHRVVFEQPMMFPVGATVGKQQMVLTVWQEGEKEEDTKLGEVVLPINRDTDAESVLRVRHGLACSLSTSWNSFDVDSEIVGLSLRVAVKGVGLSLVNSKPEELLYVSLNKLQAVLMQNENGKKTVEVKLNSCQVDNQVLGTRFPVLFGSPIDLQTMNWLHFSMVMLPHPSVLYIQYLSVLVQEMALSADSHIITQLLDFLKDIPFDLLSLSEKAPLHKLNEDPIFIEPLLIPDATLNSTSIFAEMLQLQPLLITLTNKMDPAHPLTSSILPPIPLLIPLQAVIDTLGTFVGNLDHAQIKLNSYQSENLFMTSKDLTQRLIMHYTKQFLSQLYKIFGSFNFLGNPVGLLENLGSGVKAFFYEPMQGLVRSPLEFVGGLGKGTKALVLNTTYGLVNAVSKITGTLGDGLSSLTMSEDYQSGRAAGKGGILYGLKEGVTGVYKDTVKGAKSDGFFGFVKGAGKGVAGLVLKPVAGVVDQATKVMEGVKGATKIEKTVSRSRSPRYIPKDRVLTMFEPYLADGQVFLTECKSNSEIPTDEEYMVHMKVSETVVVVVGSSRMFWIEPAKKAVTQVVKYKYLRSMQVDQRRVTFNTAKGPKPTLVISERIARLLPALQAAVAAQQWQSVNNLVVGVLIALGRPVSPEDRLLADVECQTITMATTATTTMATPAASTTASTTTTKSEMLMGDVPVTTDGNLEGENGQGQGDKAEEEIALEEEPVPTATTNQKTQLDTLTDISQAPISSARVVAHHQGVESGKLLSMGNNTFTEYEILVESKEMGVAWTVFRRFTHFKNLQDQLKAELPEAAKKLKLPGKQVKLFQTKHSLDRRGEELTAFLMCVCENASLCSSQHTAEFLKSEYVSINRL